MTSLKEADGFLAGERTSSGGVSMTPLIDVVFQLLVFFLLTSTFVLPALELTLPTADASAPMEAKEFWLVELGPERQLAVDGELVSSIVAARQSRVEAGVTVPSTARLRIDAGVAYVEVARLLRELGEAEIRHVHFVHEVGDD